MEVIYIGLSVLGFLAVLGTVREVALAYVLMLSEKSKED